MPPNAIYGRFESTPLAPPGAIPDNGLLSLTQTSLKKNGMSERVAEGIVSGWDFEYVCRRTTLLYI